MPFICLNISVSFISLFVVTLFLGYERNVKLSLNCRFFLYFFFYDCSLSRFTLVDVTRKLRYIFVCVSVTSWNRRVYVVRLMQAISDISKCVHVNRSQKMNVYNFFLLLLLCIHNVHNTRMRRYTCLQVLIIIIIINDLRHHHRRLVKTAVKSIQC